MEQPSSLTVQVTDRSLILVHIPLELYPFFGQTVLSLLFSDVPPVKKQEKAHEDGDGPRLPTHGFLNFSITPVECSVICSREAAERYFVPLANKFAGLAAEDGPRVSISKDDYIVMQVDGQGLDAGQRVLELTSPLAMAGISIFFISTYFSDYILVPSRTKDQVIRALESRGFTFEAGSDAYVNLSPQLKSSPTSPTDESPPLTPPPSSHWELQARTFESLRKRNIVPSVDPTLQLVQCAAHHRDWTSEPSWSILRPALTTTLLVDQPRFLSLTLTPADPAASLLLEKRLLPRFTNPELSSDGDEGSLLLGSKQDVLVPITLDLRELPLEATGIVCGVAGRLAAADSGREANEAGTTSPNGSKRSSFDSSSNQDASQSSPGASVTENRHSSPLPISSPHHRRHQHEQQQRHHQHHHHRHHHSHSFSSASSVSEPRSSALPTPTGQLQHQLVPDRPRNDEPGPIEISFLSTARAGTVLVGERELQRAVDALEAERRQPDESILANQS